MRRASLILVGLALVGPNLACAGSHESTPLQRAARDFCRTVRHELDQAREAAARGQLDSFTAATSYEVSSSIHREMHFCRSIRRLPLGVEDWLTQEIGTSAAAVRRFQAGQATGAELADPLTRLGAILDAFERYPLQE